jgi:hypothetical protein
MLITFRSAATESITMFGDVAQSLLKLMGATGRVPGAFSSEDVPAALARLEAEVEAMKAAAHATSAPPANNEDFSAEDDDSNGDDRDRDDNAKQPVALVTRAVPLLSLMKRAAAAHEAVSWEG